MDSLDTWAADARLATISWPSREYQQMSGDVDQLPVRLREVRLDRFGEHGIPTLSAAMEIPARTWENFEAGVRVSGWAILQFIEICGVDPHWLLTGEGERYRDGSGVPHQRSGTWSGSDEIKARLQHDKVEPGRSGSGLFDSPATPVTVAEASG